MAEPHLQLAVRMEELRQNQSCTNVVMECEGGLVHAHRCILIAASPYFDKMFTVDMSEKNTGRVQFPGISSKVINMIVKYLYVAHIPDLENDCDSLRELIATSRMMDLEDLVVKCWVLSSCDVSLETFAELWAVGTDFELVKEGVISIFFEENIEDIPVKANLESLTESQMIKLIDCVETVDQEQFRYAFIQCIFKWKSKSSGGEEEEVAVKLLKKVNLQQVDDNSLDYVLKSNCSKKTDTIENILTQEAVVRFRKLLEQNRRYHRDLITNCNTKCQHGPASCRAMTALKDLQAKHETFFA